MKLASIEKIKAITHHPNADKLDIVDVLGYQAITLRDQFNVSDLVVFIQPDTVLPDEPWTAVYKAKSNRVKAIRLRGSWSMGIVEPLSILTVGAGASTYNPYTEGQEVSTELNITKYEPPIPSDLSAKGNLPHGLFKTDEERYQNVIDLPFGEVVDVSLKIDGQSMTVYYKNGDFGITGRSLDLKLDCINNYTRAEAKYNIIDKLKTLCKARGVNLALRGEVYGKGVQSFTGNPHSQLPLDFALFGVLNLDTLKYEGSNSPFYFNTIGNALNIPVVPILEKDVILTPELIKKYDEVLTTVNGQPFEGVVIKQADGRSFKVINKTYDSKK